MSTHKEQVPASYILRHAPIDEHLLVGICYSEWNKEITEELKNGAFDTLIKSGVPEKNIVVQAVPGAFELSYVATRMLDSGRFRAVIVLGCVIRGETSHYDHICDAVAKGITELNLRGETPVIFGLVTTENKQQALDRCGGKVGHKGIEAAITALEMIDICCELQKKCVPL